MGPSFQPRAPIPWHRRLEARVLGIIAAVAAVSLGAVLIGTGHIVTTYSLAQARGDLGAARTAFSRLVETRAEAAARQTRLVVELPVFRDALGAGDAPTVTGVIADYCGKLSAHFCVVADPRGEWLGRSGIDAGAAPALAPVLAAARVPQSTTRLVAVEDGLYLVVAEPAMFGRELLGVFVAGFRLDDAVAQELAYVTHGEVSFICQRNLVCGSSLGREARAALAAALEHDRAELGATDGEPALRRIGRTSYVGGVYTLANGPVGSALVLLQDWTPTEHTLAENHAVLLGIGATALVMGVITTLLFSRRVTGPLRRLAGVADDIAGGNWDQRVAVQGPAEARTMAEAFNHMTATLTHWHTQALARERELKIVNDRFRAVTDSANDAIVSTDANGTIVFWNHRAEVVFGHAEGDAQGCSITMLVPERLRTERSNLAARFLSGDRQWMGQPLEVLGRRRDGTDVPLELSLSTWTANGSVFYTGIIRDITDRKEAADALREREEQLRQAQKMEAIGRLAGGVAHDFNNLLTGMLGYADLALLKLAEHDPARADLAEIQKAGRMAASLTRDLLAFGRKQVLQPVLLDLNAVIDDTANLIRHLVGENIDVVLDLDPGLHAVRADRGQMTQILLNLAANARDAMTAGGRITMATRNADDARDGAGRVELTVSDTGVGMSDEVKRHIFEPFFTTKAVGKGTGLGLATVYGVVSQSGGDIRVESAPGRGTAFHLSFPAGSDVRARPADGPAEPAGAAERGSETVLLVEDNDGVRAMARQALMASGYAVIEARQGEEALALAEGRLDAIGVVLTDVVMPVMGGRELASRLRAIRPDIKIIFTSGYTDDEVVAQHVLETAAAFIQKPFVPAALGRTVREVLDRAS
jgi:PAS domain S-box-containing protein